MGKSSKKKEHRRHRSSSSSSSSEDENKALERRLDQGRMQAKLHRKIEHQRQKERETPEEKRARRLAKKVKKEEKRRAAAEAEGKVLPPEINYTNTNNPFNDANLTDVFVWSKKLDAEGRKNVSKRELEKEARERISKNTREMEELKRVREAREAAKEDMEIMKRDEDRRTFTEWSAQEQKFHLQQAKLRSRIRLEQNRAQPIDLLARYVAYANGNELAAFGKGGEAKSQVDLTEFELDDPLAYVTGLSTDDYEDLLEDVKVYRRLEGFSDDRFWTDVVTVIEDELRKARALRERESVHSSVADDIQKLLKGKSADELVQLEQHVETKIRRADKGTDLGYWKHLHEQLRAQIAKKRIRDHFRTAQQLRLRKIREEQLAESAAQEKADRANQADRQEPVSVQPKIEQEVDTKEEEAIAASTSKDTVDMDLLEDARLDEERRYYRWRALNENQLEIATREVYRRKATAYEPPLDPENNAMPGIEIIAEEDDEEKRKRGRDTADANRTNSGGEGGDKDTAKRAELEAIARKGMGNDEAIFSVEHKLDPQTHLWSDKYRPRKPGYLNRVHTGFDWNKYNQTHYDVDNPPPKIVQGYRFNIFYPDLLDPGRTPSFLLMREPDPDFAVLRFSAGPPYEDVAFRIVNREWETQQKFGYKCQFANGVFQLWFFFKRYKYRR